jgi:PAS domain S-box-containing protein
MYRNTGNHKLNKTILLVEDEAAISLAVKMTLNNFGYEVEIVSSGESAVEFVTENQSIELVLMDIDLGSGIDGTEAARRILSIRTIPIIFLTSHSEREIVERVRGISHSGYVIKNNGDFVLRSAIEKVFEVFDTNKKSVVIGKDNKPPELNDDTGKLKNSGMFARATLDALSANIAILDGEGVILSVNRAWREFAIENSIELIRLCEGVNYLAVCESAVGNNSEESGKAAEGIRAVMSGSQDEFSIEYPCHAPDEKRWFNMRVTRFVFEGGLRVVVAHENITKRKNVEAELRSLSYVLEQSPVSIVITDTKGDIQYVNPAVEHTTGYSKNELLGNNPRILKSGFLQTEDYRKLWATITDGKNWKGEFHNKRKDGSFYWESATISPIFDERGVIDQFAAVKEDITERKATEEKIQNLLNEKELILKEVHHRIKNNMNTIRGLLFLQGAELKDASAAAALRDAENRIQSMMILYDKLYCSHDFREMSIKSYLGPLVDEIICSFPDSGIVKVEKNISDFVLNANIVFPLGIIVNELLTNIMKYAFKGKDIGLIIVSASMHDMQAEVTLEDDGAGIPETINFENSTGFGLNLVRMLTTQIGGTIRIERGNGTKFVLEFML